jgi:hypothetical protein
MRLPALSLTQPWASLVALGIKSCETRSWPTRVQGRIAIHAAKGYPGWAKEFREDLQEDRGIALLDPLPLGSIVAVARLLRCDSTNDPMAIPTDPIEQECGDYSPDRFVFRLGNVVSLTTPIPIRGALGFWPVPDDVIAEIGRQIGPKSSHPLGGSAPQTHQEEFVL